MASQFSRRECKPRLRVDKVLYSDKYHSQAENRTVENVTQSPSEACTATEEEIQSEWWHVQVPIRRSAFSKSATFEYQLMQEGAFDQMQRRQKEEFAVGIKQRRIALEQALVDEEEGIEKSVRAECRVLLLSNFESRSGANGQERYSVEEVRNRYIPAYTFPRFLDLPLELQRAIWVIAYFPHPEIRVLLSNDQEKRYPWDHPQFQ